MMFLKIIALTLHVSSNHGVWNPFIYNGISHNFQFPFTFQIMTLVCYNLKSLQVQIMKIINIFQQYE